MKYFTLRPVDVKKMKMKLYIRAGHESILK